MAGASTPVSLYCMLAHVGYTYTYVLQVYLPVPLYCRCMYLYLCTAGVCTCTSVLQVYPGLLGLLGFHGTFWLYSGLGLVMAVHGARVIPDNRSEPAFHIE